MGEGVAVRLDQALVGVLRLIARERSNRHGWAGRPRGAALSALTTLRSLGLIETLVPIATSDAGNKNVLIRITASGARVLAGASGAKL